MLFINKRAREAHLDMQQVGSRVKTDCSQTSQDGAGGARPRAASVGEHWPMPCALSCHVASARAALPRASRVRVSFPPPPSTPSPHWAPICRACGVEGRPRFPSATSLPAAAAATEAPTPLAPSRALSYVLRCSVLCGQGRDRWQRFIKGHARSLASCPCIVLRIYCAFVCHPTPCACLS